MRKLNYIFSNPVFFPQLFDQSKEIFRNLKFAEKKIAKKNLKFRIIGKKLSSIEKNLLFNSKNENNLKLNLKGYYEEQKIEFKKKFNKSSTMVISFKKKKLLLRYYSQLFKLNLTSFSKKKIRGFLIQSNSLQYSKFIINNSFHDHIKPVAVMWNIVVYFIFFLNQ